MSWRHITTFLTAVSLLGAAVSFACTPESGADEVPGRRHTPTPTMTATATPTPTPTATPTATIDPNATPAATPFATATASPVPALLWGAYNDQSPWDMTVQDRFEALVGRTAPLMPFGLTWYDSTGQVAFPASTMDAIRQRGSMPILDWFSTDSSGKTPGTNYQNTKIANGSQDAFLHAYARQVATWGQPFMFRFDAEMNGTWWAYADSQNGNTAGSFAVMWRHVHDIFVQEGATNAQWVFCPNTTYAGSTPYTQLYPGDAYVDWLCLDGYNSDSVAWLSFTEVFRGVNWNPYDSYGLLTALSPSKPVIIGETGSKEGGDDGSMKAAWITDALTVQLPANFPAIKAFVWFNYNWGPGQDFRVDSTPKALDAFKAAIGSSTYR